MRTRYALCLAMALAAVPAAAQTPTPPPAEGPFVTTVGEASVKKTPDRAWVTVAAESRAKTPREAQTANSAAMSAVLAKLKSSGLPAEALRTIGYDLQPEFDYANNRQTLRGYVARNSVEVRVDDLPKLGEILEGVVGAGATNVSGVRFDVKERAAAERDALNKAVADARARRCRRVGGGAQGRAGAPDPGAARHATARTTGGHDAGVHASQQRSAAGRCWRNRNSRLRHADGVGSLVIP
jgi:uncharacterized protein YggE